MEIREIECKSLVNRMQDGFFAMRYLPFRYVANIYRGCSHGCIYCYASRTHYYMKQKPEEFSKIIFVKKNCIDKLEKEIQKMKKNKSVLIFGDVADVYQPIEMKYRLTRKALEKCLEHDYPCFIETKSPLILNDIDVIEKLADRGLIGVGMTISSFDDRFTRLLEPYVPKKRGCESINHGRMETLKELSSVGVDTYLHITPYFPNISDKYIDELLKDASKAGIGNVIMAPLELSADMWSHISNVLKDDITYRDLITLYDDIYIKNGRKMGVRITLSDKYYYELERKVSRVCENYNIGYWAFINPQFNSANISGAYKWRYPILLDYWDLLSEKGEINLKNAFDLANTFPIDKRYLKKLKEYWDDSRLFKGVYGVKKQQKNGGVIYVFKEENKI